ncbi:hypothetical protein GCM10010468_04740 [Actinocorallia longicatena]|uniref:Uncharacterized protein n=1 Tax=Actinocorallia longicatena TaxID=111803 RepID=A0ABP6PXN8_9ACTN
MQMRAGEVAAVQQRSGQQARLAWRNRAAGPRREMLRGSVRGMETVWVSDDLGRRLRTPMAAWTSGAHTRIQARCSSTSGVGCTGPSGVPTGQTSLFRTNELRRYWTEPSAALPEIEVFICRGPVVGRRADPGGRRSALRHEVRFTVGVGGARPPTAGPERVTPIW